MIFPTRKPEQIIETLLRCNGIRIIMMFRNFQKARFEADRLFTFFQAQDLNSDTIQVIRRSDQWKLVLPTNSELIVLPAHQEQGILCGVRAHQIIIDETLLSDENIVNSIVRPIIASRDDIFRTGVFIYEEKTN